MRTEPGNSETHVNAKAFLAFPVCYLRVLHKHFIWGKCSCNYFFSSFLCMKHVRTSFFRRHVHFAKFFRLHRRCFFQGRMSMSHSFPPFVRIFQVVQRFKRQPFSHDFASQLPGSYHCHAGFSLKHLYSMCMKSSAATVEIWRSSPM